MTATRSRLPKSPSPPGLRARWCAIDQYIRGTIALRATLLVTGILAALPAQAQIEVKVSDDVNFKLGVLGQFQADTIDNPEPEPRTSNLFVRRLRLMFAGQVARNVSFFIETDAPNLGKTLAGGKNIQPSVILQDAFAGLRFANALTLEAGLMFVPFSRNSLQSAATLLPIDYGPNTYSDSVPTESSTGRDTGFQARGYFANDRLEYRIGAFQGFRDGGSDNAFRYAGRVQFNLLDTETGFFYTGTYLGKKKILALGAAFDGQKHFHAYAADAFVDYPVGPGAVTAQFDYNHFDGSKTLTMLARQHDILVEAGYLLKALKLTPVVQYSERNLADLANGDEKRTAVGASYWWAGQNANIKALYTRVSPRDLDSQNELTVQFQIFYF
jgi:hypothetical protein